MDKTRPEIHKAAPDLQIYSEPDGQQAGHSNY